MINQFVSEPAFNILSLVFFKTIISMSGKNKPKQVTARKNLEA